METNNGLRKVRYIAGAGTMLHQKLSDGQFIFNAGIIYEVNHADMVRLTSTGDFEEVKEKTPYLPKREKPIVIEKPELKEGDKLN
jgi:hypothetical protein